MPAEITVRDNGPLVVRDAGLVLKDAAGRPFDLAGREAVSLCRCGHSANKPFCDGAHLKAAFASKIEAFALPPKKPSPPP